MERLHTHFRQRLSDITDAEFNDRLVRIGGGEFVYPLGDIGKEVGGFEFQVVFVDANHGKLEELGVG